MTLPNNNPKKMRQHSRDRLSLTSFKMKFRLCEQFNSSRTFYKSEINNIQCKQAKHKTSCFTLFAVLFTVILSIK